MSTQPEAKSSKTSTTGATDRKAAEAGQAHDIQDTPLAHAMEESAFQVKETFAAPQLTEWQRMTSEATNLVRRNPLLAVTIAAAAGYTIAQIVGHRREITDYVSRDGTGDQAVLSKINGPRTA